ncbi:MAG: OmpA family protein [Deltaproteobacteria bacterium]|nr:OmpA family protein [Deltaproteobacteria bacterium]
MRKKNIIKGATESQTGAGWLTTFNDLVTLLMVFFVLLFSTSTIDIKKMENFKYLLQRGLGVLKEGKMTSVEVKELQPDNMSARNEEIFQTGLTPDLIEDMLKTLNSERGIKAVYTKKGVYITLDNSILFKNGVADINAECLPLLDKITTMIGKISNPVRVEGHTDNVPVHSRKFPSNWELSIARAVNVVKYFVEARKILPERLSAVGYGESKPIYPNDTSDNRVKNRRVEIILTMEEKT